MCRLFTIWFHFYFFAYFRFKFFASLHFSNFRFEAKQSEAKFKSIFLLFFALNFSLRSETRGKLFRFKRSKIQYFSHYFASQLRFGWKKNKHFYRFFRLIFVSLRLFRLIFAYFTFVFASDFWCSASKWIMWNQAFFLASKRNEIFASISNFASEAKVRAHPNPDPDWA